MVELNINHNMSTPLNQLPVVVFYVGSQQFIGAVTPRQNDANIADGPRFRVTAPCLVHTTVSQDPTKQGEIQVQMVPLFMRELLNDPDARPEFRYPSNLVIETDIELTSQLVQVYRNTLVPPVQPSFEAPAQNTQAPPVAKSLFD